MLLVTRKSECSPWDACRDWDQIQSEVPTIDVHETSDAFVVKADLPGVEKKDIDISVSEGVLSIVGERKAETESKDKGTLRTERFFGRFERHLGLPADIDDTGVHAEYKDGVLEVRLPKKQPVKPKQVKVEVR